MADIFANESDSTPSWGPRLSVRLRLEDGGFIEGQVSSLTSETFAARFAPDCGLALPLGTRVPLVLIGLGQQTMHEARVMQRSTHDGWTEYGFHSVGTSRFTATGARDRRAATRVEFTSEDALGVVVLPYYVDDTFAPIQAQVADASRLGLGIAMPDDAEDNLYACDHVRLALSLPGETDPLRFVGTVRHRRFQGVLLRYGVELDPVRTEDYAAHEARLSRYVIRRQIDAIRRANRWQRVS